MQSDPMEEWRRLTALYSEMGDIEIRDLVDQINDLTPAAQQILRDELKKRGVSEKGLSTAPGEQPGDNAASVHWDDSEDGVDGEGGERATEYTWKTGLRRCETFDEARQRGEMLRRAGVESWVQRPGARFPVPLDFEHGTGGFQVNVAADQLEHALVVMAQPIPQDIIDEMTGDEAALAYEVPVCPQCGAEDPTLESVEPGNNWLCESCGHQWSDPADHSAPGQ